MSTVYPFVAEQLADVIKQPSKDVVVNRARLESFNDRATQFTCLLQTTLDTERLLKIFAAQAANIIPFAAISYRNHSHASDITIGEHARHRCSYNLTLEESTLGEICISRRKRFTEEDLELFERLVALLLYPLRNCLTFQQANQAASKDPMTGLSNRRSMDEHIDHESQMALRYDNPLSMLVLDIDHFKRINDSYGHKAGDCLIKALADTLSQTARTTDYTFRYGGEEFVMLLPNTSTKGAQLVAERIRQTVEATECFCEEQIMKMTVSIGVSTLLKSDQKDSLFTRADSALYQAKQGGRNRVCTANE